MSGLRAFSPLRDFSAPPAGAETAAPPQIGLEEAERLAAEAAAAARRAALEEGKALGFAEAEAGHSAALAEAARRIASVLEEEHDALAQRLEAAELRATRLVLAIVRKLAARLGEEESRKVCERIAPQAIAAAAASSRFVIAVPESAAAGLREALAPELVRRSLSPEDFVRGDPSLADGAIRAEWSGGGVFFDPAERQAAMDALIEEALSRLDTPSSDTEEEGRQRA